MEKDAYISVADHSKKRYFSEKQYNRFPEAEKKRWIPEAAFKSQIDESEQRIGINTAANTEAFKAKETLAEVIEELGIEHGGEDNVADYAITVAAKLRVNDAVVGELNDIVASLKQIAEADKAEISKLNDKVARLEVGDLATLSMQIDALEAEKKSLQEQLAAAKKKGK